MIIIPQTKGGVDNITGCNLKVIIFYLHRIFQYKINVKFFFKVKEIFSPIDLARVAGLLWLPEWQYLKILTPS